MIIRREKSKNYSIISNECLKNPKISTRAKGIYAYIMTLPDDWQIQKKELYQHFAESRDYLDKGFNDLKKHGYVKQTRVQDEKGRFIGWEYVVYEFVQNHEKSPTSCLPKSELPKSVDHPLLNTNYKQNTKKKLNTNKQKDITKSNHKSIDTTENLNLSNSQSVSSCFLLDEKEYQGINKTEDLSNDLLSIGLGSSQIKAVLRSYEINLIDEAIVSTFQAQYQNRISESASQYFYGVLNKLKEKDHQDLTLTSKTNSLGKCYV